jgi:all-trans-retinol dehydrogenase (NAD+)
MLWNNAGIARVKDLLGSKPEDLEQTIQINLISHFWTLRAFLPSMIEKNHGHIITTASLGAYFGAKYGMAYFAAKFGIRGWVESLQDELRVHPKNPDKIKFTTIFPSFVRTPLTKGVILKIK